MQLAMKVVLTVTVAAVVVSLLLYLSGGISSGSFSRVRALGTGIGIPLAFIYMRKYPPKKKARRRGRDE